MLTRFALATNNVDLDRGVRQALFLLGLRLVDNLLGNEDLLNDLPQRRDIVIQQNAGGQAPANKEHHDSHDDTHSLHALSLGARLIASHIQLRNQGQDGEQHQRDDIGKRGGKTISHGGGRRRNQARKDVEKREGSLVIREVVRQIAKKREQREQQGHLDE